MVSDGGFAAGAMVPVCMLGLLFFCDPLLNRFIKHWSF